MILVRIAFAWLALAPLALAQERETRTETWPDGTTRSEYEVALTDGELVRDGDYAGFHPDGSRESKGRYRAGERHGAWKFWYSGGKDLRCRGKYAYGLREGPWKAWLQDGEPDPSESGVYGHASVEYESGALRAKGPVKDGALHGHWTFLWEHGGELASGAYRGGRQSGVWIFRHGDGVVDPAWITGVYEDGRRVRDLEPEELEVEEIAVEWPPLAIDPSLTDDELDLARQQILRCMEVEDHEPGRAYARKVRAFGRRADALLLVELEALDPASAEDVTREHRLEGLLLGPLASNGVFGWWRPPTSPKDVAANALLVRRWKSLLSLARHDPSFLDFELRLAAPQVDSSGWRDLTVMSPTLHLPATDADGRPIAASRQLARRIERRARADDEDPTALGESREAALAWLAAHQMPDGSWSGAAFAGIGEQAEPCGCDGEGHAGHEVGNSALALLALTVDGSTPSAGPYRREVSNGLLYLLRRQDPRTGLIGGRRVSHFVYDHAIATQALLEAYLSSNNQALLVPIERALDYIQLARNPYLAWRYSVPPDGQNDTSVTAWMLAAIMLARDSGFEVDSHTLEGGMAWIDEATDQATGRCGYDSKGSLSARINRVNDHFPNDRNEPMTAAALFVRQQIGPWGWQDDTKNVRPIVKKHARLLAAALPEWDRDGLLVDFYYWYWGAQALSLFGGRTWNAWNTSMRKALLDSQRKDGHLAGSWDPIGAWGFSTGRVGTTAFAALTLQSHFRFARSEEQH